ncbi:MAG: DUF3788 domain-containing protein [Dehalococcoidia bacterium]|nr:DUF3788 domain-containing protein [Dehalococcoidia bacterium]
MSISVLSEKARVPDGAMVAAVVGDTYILWNKLVNHIKEKYPNVTEEWKYYGKAFGWTFKVISKKRNLLFLVPLDGCLRTRIVLGEKAVACAESADLPDELKLTISYATPHVEGRSIDLGISCPEQLETVKTLLKIKFEN